MPEVTLYENLRDKFEVKVDGGNRILIINGIRFSFEIFKFLSEAANSGKLFRLVNVDKGRGMVTVSTIYGEE